jgi:alpha-N-arabinofuranosidase
MSRKLAVLLLLLIVASSFSAIFFAKYFPGSIVQNRTSEEISPVSASTLFASISVNASNILAPVNKLDYGANLAIVWEKGMFVGGNMIHDSGFEGPDTTGSGIPDGWIPDQHGNITVVFSRDDTAKVGGNWSEKVQITSLSGFADAGPLQNWLFIKYGHTYEVSFYAKESGTSGKTVVELQYDHPPWALLSSDQVTVTSKWAKYTVYLTSPQTTSAQVGVEFGEVGTMWLDDVTMVDVNATGVSIDPTILSKIREVGPTALRFPGGELSDEYDWETDIGPNYGGSWSFDRFMLAVQALNATPVVTVNYASGSAKEAADWVAYANAPSDGSNYWGSLRAAYGHPTPYDVRYWEIGNEVYGTGITSGTTYANDFIKYVQQMKTVDPTIKVGADMPESINSTSDLISWAKPVLTIAGEYVDFIVYHRYYPRHVEASSLDIYYGTMAATYDLQARHQEYLNLIDQLLPQNAGKIPIAVTEYNAFYDYDHPRGGTLEAGLLVADYLLYFASHVYVSMAMIWDLINQPDVPPDGYPFSIINNFLSLSTRPTGYAIEMFTSHFGDELVSASINSPTFNVTQQIGFVQPTNNVPYLDAVVSVSNNTLYLIVINKHYSNNIQTTITVNGFVPQQDARVYALDGPNIDSSNEYVPDTVTITPSAFNGASSVFTYTFPAHSVTSIELTKENAAPVQSVAIRSWAQLEGEGIPIERELLLAYCIQGWLTLTETNQPSRRNFAFSRLIPRSDSKSVAERVQCAFV